MKLKDVEQSLCDIVEEEFLNQTEQKQYLHEAQVQFKIAIALYKRGVTDITLEWYAPYGDTDRFIDLMFMTEDKKRVAVELKYRTVEVNGFLYKNQNNQYSGRYDFLVDVARLESLKDDDRSDYRIDAGFAILIANDHLYWSKPRKGKGAAGVYLGSKISADKEYAYNGRRSEPVKLKQDYPVCWLPERSADELKRDGFRYLLVAVPEKNAE